ncbi:MAG: DNA-binding protein [Proteobacteria bacterium]|nr:DNA-binding protein [Pseudomonadota bacterium]
MTNVDLLLRVSGGSPLLTLPQLANVLNKKPAHIHWALSTDSELGKKLQPAKTRLGRHIYFRVIDLAKVLDESVE